MKIKIEKYCDKAMNDWAIIDYVTDVFKAAEGKKMACHFKHQYRNSIHPWIVLRVGENLATTNARLEDEKGILAKFVYGRGFVPEERENAYQLI